MRHLVLCSLLFAATTAAAGEPRSILDGYARQAAIDDPKFSEFSATRGAEFYRQRHAADGGELSCGTCHTNDPIAGGKHHKTHKSIEPLAPAANPERFTDAAKVEKWFRRNCREVLGRECTAAEKGDFITYLISVR